MRLTGIKACVFDAYGTLFDVGNVTRSAGRELGELWRPLADLWRTKQLQYTWLRSVAGRHADLWQVTGEALDYSLKSLGLNDMGLRDRPMNRYLELTVYPDVRPALAALKSAGIARAILSNGTPHMLASALQNSGTADCFDAVLSVEEVGVFKPHPSVYELAPQRLGIGAQEICFISSNGWDAWSAKAFGFQVLWCNRTAQTAECMPSQPDGEIADLSMLPPMIG
jgi:2-haloacid dehalogenase